MNILNFRKLTSLLLFFPLAVFSNLNAKGFPNALNVNSKLSASLQGNFIYWLPLQEGMDFAETKTNGSYEILQAPYHFEPGYKVAMSLFPDFDGADLSFRFTWLQQPFREKTFNVSPDTSCDNPEGEICEIRADKLGYYNKPYPFVKDIHSASSKWFFQIIEADIEFAKRFKLSPSFFFRPYLGLKSIWQKQTLAVEYDLNFHHMLYLTEYIDSSQHSFGIGPRTGFDMKYRFNRRFGIFANAAYSLVSTRFKSGTLIYTHAEDLSSQTVFHSGRKVSNTQPVYEFLVGLDFDTYYLKNKFHLNYFLGWEFQYLNQNNHLIINPNDFRDGDLSLQGLNFKMQFDF